MAYKAFLLLFALICISQAHFHSFGCDHDDHEKIEPGFLDVEEDFPPRHNEGRMLESAPQMRMYAHFDTLTTAPASYRAYLENDLVPPVLAYFGKALKVKYPVIGKLKLAPSVKKVCDARTPSILHTTGVDADYFIFFLSRKENSNNIALSQYCYLASGSKRPLIAQTNFNRNMLYEANGNALVHEKNIYLLMHEIVHTLGFTTYAYEYFLDANGDRRKNHVKRLQIGGKHRTVLDVAPLTDKVRKYFGCSSMPGAIMENSGGSSTASSHFERNIFLYDLMTSGLIEGHRISELTLALLEGSGWYIPDYNYAEPYFWGQGQGCEFVTGSCNNKNTQFDEFCQKEKRGCGAMGRAGGYCQSSSLMDGCKFYFPFEDNDCDNSDGYDNTRLPELQVYGRGAGSKCFTGDLNTRRSSNGRSTFCFKYTCSGSGQNTQVEIKVGNNKIVCTEEGEQTIDGYFGAVDCPDPQTFCNTVGKKYCPRNCMGRGDCVDNKCQCDKGFTGIDCSERA